MARMARAGKTGRLLLKGDPGLKTYDSRKYVRCPPISICFYVATVFWGSDLRND